MTDLSARAHAIAVDRDSSASELAERLLPLLDAALAVGRDAVAEVIRRVCRGQPAMAPLWHACAAALDETERPGGFRRYRQARERAPSALIRVASALLLEEWANLERPVVLTLSFSSQVLEVLRAVQRRNPLRIVCGEARPRYEGRRLATLLGEAGADVTLTTDAALARYLREAAAVVVGADSLAASFWINKVGTASLAATAHLFGVPVFVVSSADKALPRALADRWQPTAGDPAEVWNGSPASVQVDNHYFEAIPAELVTGFLVEAGRLTPEDLPRFADRGAAEIGRLLEFLTQL